MNEHQMTRFRDNIIVWVLLLFLSVVGLAILVGRLLLPDEVIQFFVLFSPDGKLEPFTLAFIDQITPPFIVFHLGLALIGWVLLFSKPRLASQGYFHINQRKHKRFNFFILSSYLSIYLFGLFNIPELVTGLRLPIFREDSFFEYITAVAFFIAAILFFLAILQIRKDIHTKNKLGITIFFLFLIVISILIAGEEISWGQRVFGWDTPNWIALKNRQDETNIHNLLPRLAVIEWGAGAIFSIILFGVWLGFKESYRTRLEMIIPPIELYISAALAISSSGNTSSELFEELISIFFLLYSIWILKEWRDRIRATNLSTTDK